MATTSIPKWDKNARKETGTVQISPDEVQAVGRFTLKGPSGDNLDGTSIRLKSGVRHLTKANYHEVCRDLGVKPDGASEAKPTQGNFPRPGSSVPSAKGG